MFYWLLFVLLFIFQASVTTSQFHLYHTDHVSDNSLDHDCLLYNVASINQNHVNPQNKNSDPYQIIPYCIRPFGLPSSLLVNNEKRVIHGTSITFETLQKENITSQQLYLLSAPIDVVERYQAFLENSYSFLSTQVFNNCSKPWILWAYLTYPKQEINNAFKNGTCYIFIECNRGPLPSCLDWREICDEKIDCLDGGQDEIGCEILHINEYKEHEFRCSNGFCIPKEFFNDDSSSPDCMDNSDEKYNNMEDRFSGKVACKTDPMFRCEETTCRNERMLSCGDGQCTMHKCSSNREVQLKKAKLSQNANSHLLFNCWRTTTVETVHSNPLNFERSLESQNHGLNSICNRGIFIYVTNFTENSCLCPPAYFGHRCEYQNQRISLTLQFRTVELRTVFNFVIMLVDENANIHSSEQLDYVSVRDCRKKFNFYLLYSTRPKHANQTYYVRIDTYNKEKMEYYVTMVYPIEYSFIPVHRLSLQVDVPVPEVTTKSKICPLKCFHGQCRHFSNSDQYFCQCSDGYSGMLCTINNSCDCSSNSICIGVVNNRSICVCPLDKFGPRCYLKRTVCVSNLCSNNSRCIPGGEKNPEMEYFCLCSQGYMGSRCENLETKIEFHFSKTISIPQTIFIHFVYIPPTPNSLSKLPPPDPTQITMISKLKFHESSTVVYYGGAFHLIFVEFHQQYYLALLQHNFTSAMNVSTTIIPEHRCLSIKDLFADHIQTLPRWHRAKKYYIPCQKYSNLTCFYDSDYFMCLCDIDRYPNCFKFDYRPAYNCLGYNYCENDGQCFQDNSTCPTSSSCFCKECYHGSQCQFTTTGFGLSLDDILG
ncbi:unnamed protein product [Rotaria sp. Silwood1]|nr:unnamed protein product [Rotaria sp. Silwood1]